MIIIPQEFLWFLGTGEDCSCGESWVLTDLIFTEVDYITLSWLEVYAGFTDIQISDYYLLISFMDAPHLPVHGCLVNELSIWILCV